MSKMAQRRAAGRRGESKGAKCRAEEEARVGNEVPWRRASAALRGRERSEEGAQLRNDKMTSVAEQALRADYMGVQAELEALDSAGIRPGPEVWHGLIASLCKQLDADGSLRAAWDAHAEGEKLLPESYSDLLRAFCAAGDDIRRDETLDALARCGGSWWSSGVATLFRFGQSDRACALFEHHLSIFGNRNEDIFAGAEEVEELENNDDAVTDEAASGIPPVDNAAALLYCEHLSKEGEIDKALESAKRLGESAERACRLGALRGLVYCGNGSAGQALDILADMPAGGRSDEPYATALEVLLRNADGYQLDGSQVDEVIRQLRELMDQRNVQQGAEWLCKCVEARVRSGDAESAADGITMLAEGGTGFLGTRVSMQTAGVVVQGLSSNGSGEKLANVLESLQAESVSLPARTKAVDSTGRTLTTRWLLYDEIGSLAMPSTSAGNASSAGAPESSSEVKEDPEFEHLKEERGCKALVAEILDRLPGITKMKADDLKNELESLGLTPFKRRAENYRCLSRWRNILKASRSLADPNSSEKVLRQYARYVGLLDSDAISVEGESDEDDGDGSDVSNSFSADAAKQRFDIGVRLLNVRIAKALCISNAEGCCALTGGWRACLVVLCRHCRP